MDGYAVRSQDTAAAPVRLRVAGEITAGQEHRLRLGQGEVIAITTGSPMPEGGDAVQIVENSERLSPSEVLLLGSVVEGENVSAQGDETKKGEIVLAQGQLVGPSQTGVLASFGKSAVEVFAAPRVSLIPTGNEIVDVGNTRSFGQIYNSNAHMLAAQCRRLGVSVEILPLAVDDVGSIRKRLNEGLSRADIVVLTGGVSVGQRDYVPRVLAEEGVEILFHGVAIKPGKPVLLARKDQNLIFGLPGNPVSSFVTLELFVRPAIRRWMGYDGAFLPLIRASLEGRIERRPGRTFFAAGAVRSVEDELRVRPVKTKGSADLTAFSRANSLIVMPAQRSLLAEGERVEVVLLEAFFQEGTTNGIQSPG
jgi:molybdenum cofactor synthesis domain-containing protein